MTRFVADFHMYGQIAVEAANPAEARRLLERALGLCEGCNDAGILLLSRGLDGEAPLTVNAADPAIGMIGIRPDSSELKPPLSRCA